ncbi:AAA family ATPase [Bradyrhizobium sp. HKCCYLS20291]|uniref:AAA family ATPase n=1 Tax=Bradyrhizobium sp. HKCCYLS20291 TaxID=3420766 RepID=UPI003EBF2AF8
MRLTYFAIENFRSISCATFNDSANVTSLVGPNNEGKSNILECWKICLELLWGSRIVSGREAVSVGPIEHHKR